MAKMIKLPPDMPVLGLHGLAVVPGKHPGRKSMVMQTSQGLVAINLDRAQMLRIAKELTDAAADMPSPRDLS